MKTAIIALAAAACATLASCEIESEIDFETTYGGDKIVLNAYISEADGVVATIKKTVPPNCPTADNTIGDASILLLVDGNVADTLKTEDNRNYALTNSSHRIASGHRYALRAVSPTYGTAQSGEVTLPQAVSITTVAKESTRGNYLVAFDNTSKENAYFVKTKTYRDGKPDNWTWGEALSWTFTTDMPVGTNRLEVMGIDFELHYRKADSISVLLYVYSPELKEYFESYADYKDTRRDVYYDMAYPVTSNISGGLGFVGTYAVSSFTIVNSDKDDEASDNAY